MCAWPVPSATEYTVASVERQGCERKPLGNNWMKAPMVGIAGPPESGLVNCIFQPWQASGSPFFASAASASRLRA